jgi:hypothetical protein
MKRKNTPVAAMIIRMERLPRRHRIAHLRALIAREPLCTIRRLELAALLREEMTTQLVRDRAG